MSFNKYSDVAQSHTESDLTDITDLYASDGLSSPSPMKPTRHSSMSNTSLQYTEYDIVLEGQEGSPLSHSKEQNNSYSNTGSLMSTSSLLEESEVHLTSPIIYMNEKNYDYPEVDPIHADKDLERELEEELAEDHAEQQEEDEIIGEEQEEDLESIEGGPEESSDMESIEERSLTSVQPIVGSKSEVSLPEVDEPVVTQTQERPHSIRKNMKDFKIGKELGEGSYSTVMLATDVSNNKQYAIKILDKKHIIKEKKVKYVNIEKNALNRLGNRDGIIHLYYTFQDDKNLYFVLNYAPNGELLTLIKKYGSMNEECVKYYTTQIVDGIKYMHDNGIIHRDIKPENILIDEKMRAQITDFGTAKMLERKPETNKYPLDCRASSFVGTAEYVSPELLNDKYSGKPSDIWALGCIIYQMIAGKPPFKASNEYLTFQKVCKLQYAFSAGFPMVLRDLVKRILILKPRERLTIKDIQKHYFFQDVNWSDHDSIWNISPPPLSPYKMSAKSMMPIPELNKTPIPSNSIAVMPTPSRKAPQRSVSTSNIEMNGPTTVLGNSSSTVYGLPIPTSLLESQTHSSPTLQTENLSTAAAVATSKKLAQSAGVQIPKARSAGNSPKIGGPAPESISGQTTTLPPNTSGQTRYYKMVSKTVPVGSPSTSTDQVLVPPTKTATSSRSSSGSSIGITGTAGTTRYNKNQSSQSQQPAASPSVSVSSAATSYVDLIPGTNIPRPTLSSRVNTSRSISANSSLKNLYGSSSSLTMGSTVSSKASSSQRGSIGRTGTNNSNIISKREIPPLSILDMNWVDYFVDSDERVIKVGFVNVSKYQSEVFEKKYKGMLTESPLGYKNKEIYASSDSFHVYGNNHGNVDNDDAITFIEDPDEGKDSIGNDDSLDNEDENSSDKPKTEGTISSTGSGNNNNGSIGSSGNTNGSSTGGGLFKQSRKLKSLFTYSSKSSNSEPTFKRRILLITSVGRAIVFKENHDRKKDKYQIAIDIDLCNKYINFKEIIGGIEKNKSKPLNAFTSTFAICSKNVTLAFEVESAELSPWTQSLAKARSLEQERKAKKVIMEKMNPNSTNIKRISSNSNSSRNAGSTTTTTYTNNNNVTSSKASVAKAALKVTTTFRKKNEAKSAVTSPSTITASTKSNSTMSPPLLSLEFPSPSSPILDYNFDKQIPKQQSATTTAAATAAAAVVTNSMNRLNRKPPPNSPPLPPGSSSAFPSSMRSASGNQGNHNSKNGEQKRRSEEISKRVISNNSPMITAAITKALADAEIASNGQGNGYSSSSSASNSSGNKPRLITSMNSKFLARSNRKH